MVSIRPKVHPWDVLYEDETLHVWAERDIVAAAWFDAPVLAQMLELRRVASERQRAFPKGVGLFQLIVRGTPRFSDDVRAEAARMARERVFSRGACHVILVPGLAGAATRAFISTLLLLRRAKTPVKVFGDLAEGARWFASEMDGWQGSRLFELGSAVVASGDAPHTS